MLTKPQLFAPADRFSASLRHVLATEASARELDVLRLHAAAPRRTITMTQVAAKMGWKDQIVANGTYGRLARKVGVRLGISKPEEGFFGILLMDWASSKTGTQTSFTLRSEVVDAMQAVGIITADGVK